MIIARHSAPRVSLATLGAIGPAFRTVANPMSCDRNCSQRRPWSVAGTCVLGCSAGPGAAAAGAASRSPWTMARGRGARQPLPDCTSTNMAPSPLDATPVRVVGISPNPAAVTRLVGAIPLERRDEWPVERARYLPLAADAKNLPTSTRRTAHRCGLKPPSTHWRARAHPDACCTTSRGTIQERDREELTGGVRRCLCLC